MLGSKIHGHLSYDKHSPTGNNSSNNYHEGQFDPKTIERYLTKTDDLENALLLCT